MAEGWISIKRKITGNWLWQEKPFSEGQAFIDLLIMAQHKKKELMLKGDKVKLQRGQLATSERKLGGRWGWSRGKVRNYIAKLEKDGMIKTHKKPKGNTVITIVNYDIHQSSPQ